MGSVLEQTMYDGVLEIVGDPLYIGVIVLIFFGGFVILQNTSLPQKTLIITAAAFLATAYIPFIGLIAGFVTAALLYAGIMRLVSK